MTRPAENQQTVEALAEKIGLALDLLYNYTEPLGEGRSFTHDEGRAALRDLVAQAELAAEMGEALRVLRYSRSEGTPGREEIDALLARLDGAS